MHDGMVGSLLQTFLEELKRKEAMSLVRVTPFDPEPYLYFSGVRMDQFLYPIRLCEANIVNCWNRVVDGFSRGRRH